MCRIRLVTRSIADVAAELDALTAADFDAASERADGWERLATLLDLMDRSHE
jgi:hypothetical protein